MQVDLRSRFNQPVSYSQTITMSAWEKERKPVLVLPVPVAMPMPKVSINKQWDGCPMSGV